MLFRALFFLAAAAASVSAATKGCLEANTISDKKYTSPDGVEFGVRTSTCKTARPAGNVTTIAERSYIPETHLVKRPIQECTKPNECFCGSSCVTPITCYFSPGLLLPADCRSLTSAVLATFKGSFFIGPALAQTVYLGTCEYSFTNDFPVETIEYCWDDLANYGLAMSEICVAEEAECLGPASLWWIDLLWK